MLRLLRGWLLALLALVLAVGIAAWLLLRASLPDLDGERMLGGLDSDVTIDRDTQGVPTVTARNRLDLARATGFLHAQERFFQMDLQRRLPAGELSALVGPSALDSDRRMRPHQLRRRAQEIVAYADPTDQSVLFAYTHGVNEGLSQLLSKPFEYFLLRGQPEPWHPEDSLLVLYAMFLDLTDENADREWQLAAMRQTLPAPLLEFLVPPGTPWDAPLRGASLPLPPVPGAAEVDLRGRPSAMATASAVTARRLDLGSNSLAVDAQRGTRGAAVAGDMHLGLSVPNIWYRMRMVVDGAARGLDAVGVTLPGVPSLVAGSNRSIAWAFTNSYGDWSDLVVLEPDPDDPARYRGPDGGLEFGHARATISVKGEDPDSLEWLTTIWGPVVEHAGQRYALHWLAHEPEAVNLRLMRLEQAQTVEEAIEIANGSGIPPQNLLVADTRGDIGWTIAGHLPRRVGFDGGTPVSWLDGRGWQGWLPAAAYPRLVEPAQGRLWTGNARTVDGQDLALLGDGGYAFGARAAQLRDGLMARERFAPADLLTIELDDRALYLARWQTLLVRVLARASPAEGGLRPQALDALNDWGARASVDSVGYRIVRQWHDRCYDAVTGWLTAPARALDADFDFRPFPQAEAAVLALLGEQPDHLLDSAYSSWDAFMLDRLDQTLRAMAGEDGTLAGRSWGEANRLRMRHPLSRALPFLSPLLDMPATPLPGDADLPRVQQPRAGASQRMVIVPGREDESLFHMPGGQSGHPLSPYYDAGHQAWVEGLPTPLLPQQTRWTLHLRPAE